MTSTRLAVAVCTYNRAARLPALVRTLREQACTVDFDILIVNNDSQDETARILEQLAREPGVPLRFVLERSSGIVPARNRAVAECLDRDYLIFLDDDELPRPGFLQAAINCFDTHPDAVCLGGKVKVDFSGNARPAWLEDNLLGFLAETDYGDEEFWVTDGNTPIWTANVGYRMKIFRDHPELRFDGRYNRVGKGVAGGEDAMMFNEMLKRGMPMRYCPGMVVDHAIEPWRLSRFYFLKRHFVSGRLSGQWELDVAGRTFLGVPGFLFGQMLNQASKSLGMTLRREKGTLRQAMTAAHALGMILGCHARWRNEAGLPGAKPASGSAG